jgi:hypothetical protein
MSGLQAEVDEEACADRLEELRERYEPYAIAIAISRHPALDLPDWLPDGDVLGTWRAAAERSARDRLLP